MKRYHIHIEPQVDETIKHIIEDYWQIENGEFVNTVVSLTKKHALKDYQITKLIKGNSHCIVCEKCFKCDDYIDRQIETRGRFNIYRYPPLLCQKCKEESGRIEFQKMQQFLRQNQIEEDKLEKEKKDKFSKAISSKKWLDLNKFELETLGKIIKNKDLDSIKKNVFNGDFFDKYIWNAVNRLERTGLIHIVRGSAKKVLAFEFDQTLEKYIALPTQTDVADYLSFSLAVNSFKTAIKQPHYSGTFTLPSDVILKANEKYLYGGWVQTDGSINLKFTPIKDIKKTEQTTIENEPQIVSEIIGNMFDYLKKDEE